MLDFLLPVPGLRKETFSPRENGKIGIFKMTNHGRITLKSPSAVTGSHRIVNRARGTSI